MTTTAETPRPTPEALAKAFADVLEGWLTHKQWKEMRRRNVFNTDNGCCASHDFCDANMAMDEAFTDLVGRSICPDEDGEMDDADVKLWNAAWDIAKATYFTAH